MIDAAPSPLDCALARLTIPEIWRRLGLPGKPGASCRSPFREDRHPSFAIYADGRRYHDHATGEDGDAADFVAAASRVPRDAGCRLLIAMAGTGGKAPGITVVPPAPPAAKYDPLADKEKAAARARWPAFEPPTAREIATIAALRDLSPEGVAAAAHRGLLFCGAWKGRRAWIITDAARVNAQARRFDGAPWVEVDSKAQSLPGSVGSWPIGIKEAARYPAVALCEGGGDLLAAYHLAWCADVLANLGVVATFGARNHIIDAALPCFAGKRCRIFVDDDPDGYAGADVWTQQLRAAGATVDGFGFRGFRQADGAPVKDLNDFVRVDPDQWEAERAVVESAFDFVPATSFSTPP